MADRAINSPANIWSVPECPFQIEASPRVLDDIRLSVVDAFFSLPRGGAEIGGILLGNFRSGRLTITGYAGLDCEHAYGPSFTLSPPDEARLKTLLAQHSGGPDGMRPVGWYHSHTRSEIFLSEADLKIHNQYFPESWQVALVIKPHTFQPARIGYFFREAAGAIHATASYREITLEALPIRQVPTGVPTTAAADRTPLRRWRPEPPPPEPEPEPEAAPEPQLARVEPPPMPPPQPPSAPPPQPPAEPIAEAAVEEPRDLPAPQFLTAEPPAQSRRWVAVLGIAIGLGAGAAAFQTRQVWLPKVMAAINPAPPAPAPAPAPPPALGLNVSDFDGEMQITWDRNSPALLQVSDAALEITDGPSPQSVQLDTTHLRTGTFTYARQTEKVDIKLIAHRSKASDLREAISFLGKLPDRKPAPEDPEVQKQRDALAKQAAKLKLDLNWQSIKTKKLEKDLKSARDELRQQQMKRMTNQAPDKQ
jgi:proteasome lid subunit RPN8/RPN11